MPPHLLCPRVLIARKFTQFGESSEEASLSRDDPSSDDSLAPASLYNKCRFTDGRSTMTRCERRRDLQALRIVTEDIPRCGEPPRWENTNRGEEAQNRTEITRMFLWWARIFDFPLFRALFLSLSRRAPSRAIEILYRRRRFSRAPLARHFERRAPN